MKKCLFVSSIKAFPKNLVLFVFFCIKASKDDKTLTESRKDLTCFKSDHRNEEVIQYSFIS